MSDFLETIKKKDIVVLDVHTEKGYADWLIDSATSVVLVDKTFKADFEHLKKKSDGVLSSWRTPKCCPRKIARL